MEYAFRVDVWQALYTAVASAVAALTGLLFIGLSLNLRTIIKTPAHKARARQTFAGLLALLILSLLLLIPGQDRRLLGAELLAGIVVMAIIGARLQSQVIRSMAAQERRHWILLTLLSHLGTLTLIVAAISLIVGQFGGLFWLVPTILIYLLWSLNSAWVLMVQAVEEEPGFDHHFITTGPKPGTEHSLQTESDVHQSLLPKR